MTYVGIFDKCQTLEELKKQKDYVIAISANPYDDSLFSKLIIADIDNAFKSVCEQKGWNNE